MRENADQNNTEYGHFLRSDTVEYSFVENSLTPNFYEEDIENFLISDKLLHVRENSQIAVLKLKDLPLNVKIIQLHASIRMDKKTEL